MKTANTWEDLVKNYEVFINTDVVSAEAIHDDIAAWAAKNKLPFTEVLDKLYEAIFGPELF